MKNNNIVDSDNRSVKLEALHEESLVSEDPEFLKQPLQFRPSQPVPELTPIQEQQVEDEQLQNVNVFDYARQFSYEYENRAT